jgi:hypothetical protein
MTETERLREALVKLAAHTNDVATDDNLLKPAERVRQLREIAKEAWGAAHRGAR